jgi:hypothetical protein
MYAMTLFYFLFLLIRIEVGSFSTASFFAIAVLTSLLVGVTVFRLATGADQDKSVAAPLVPSLPDRDALLRSMIDEVRSEILRAAVAQQLAPYERALSILQRQVDGTVARLQNEILNLRVKGKVSLAFGAGATSIAVLLLVGFVILDSSNVVTTATISPAHQAVTSAHSGGTPLAPATMSSMPRALSEDVAPRVLLLIPRLSIAILIEVFAYFFLKLYRRTLDDIKYFQIQITTVEQRALAVSIAVVTPANAAILDVLRVMALSEVTSIGSESAREGESNGGREKLMELTKQIIELLQAKKAG